MIETKNIHFKNTITIDSIKKGYDGYHNTSRYF